MAETNGELAKQIQAILNGEEAIPKKVTNKLLFLALTEERHRAKNDTKAIRQLIVPLCENVDKINVVLFGDNLDGKNGTLKEVAENNEYVKNRKYWQRVLVGAAIANAIGIIFLIFK